MIDVPLTVLAWVSVVVVQAVIHYMVLGFRSAQKDDVIVQEMDVVPADDCQSVITTSNASDTITSCSYLDIVSLVDSIDKDDYDDDATTSTIGSQ